MRFRNLGKRIQGDVIHLCVGNRYRSTEQIACLKSRLSLPKKHDSTYCLARVNCKLCIIIMIQKREKEIELLNLMLETAIDSGLRVRAPKKAEIYFDERVQL